MSQYGAYGFAKARPRPRVHPRPLLLGHGARRARRPPEVRVLLRSAARMPLSRRERRRGRRAAPDRRRQTYSATRALGGNVVLRAPSGRSLGTFKAPLRISGAGGGVLVRGRAAERRARTAATAATSTCARRRSAWRRSTSSASRTTSAASSPARCPSHWPAAALRAQAIAARTYAIATSKDGDGFDQYADTRSQMYIGIAGEVASTNAAVAATRGNVVAYEGTPIVTYYFSTSGGRTENVENSFIGAEPKPWLKSVADPYDGASPRHRWTRRMTLGRRARRLGSLVKGEPAPDQGPAPRALAARRARAGRRHGRHDRRHRPAAALQARPASTRGRASR